MTAGTGLPEAFEAIKDAALLIMSKVTKPSQADYAALIKALDDMYKVAGAK